MSFAPYPAYKDSGVPWLGQVPEAWEVKPVKYVSTFNDEALTETTDPELMLNYVDISSVSLVEGITKIEQVEFEKAPSRARRVVREGDTIVSTVRTYLKAIAPIRNPVDNMIVSTGFAVIRPDQTMNPDFLGYFIQSEGFVGEVVSKSTGVSYPAINPGNLVAISGVRPPIEEQTAIADFLDKKTAEIDDLIAKKEELLRLLAEQRTALITHAVTKGLNPNAPMKPSGINWLGDVPEGWEVKPIKHLLSPKKGAIKTGPFGSQLTSSDMFSGEIKVYNQRTVLDNDFDAGLNYISLEKFNDLQAFEVFPGDVLVTTRGTIGRTALAPHGIERGILHPCLMRLQINEKLASSEYISMLISSSGIVLDQLTLASNATTIEVIYSETLKNALVVLPPLAMQKEILVHLSAALGSVDNAQKKVAEAIGHLREYRTALITNAVTGRIKVA